MQSLCHLQDLSDSSPKSCSFFSREVPCMAPVIARAVLYCIDSSFLQKDLF